MGVVQGDIGGGGGTDATITFTDITTNDSSTTKHGFLPKLAGTSTKFFRDDGSWQAISGGGDALVANPLSQFATTTSAQLATVLSDENGSGGGFVRATGATLTTPTLGVAAATSINKVALTAPAAGSTLTIADGVTLTCSASVDTNNLAPKASPTLTTPTLGVATATSVNKVAITAPATSATLTIADGVTLTASASVDTNNLAPKASPTFTGTVTTAAVAMANNNLAGAKQVCFNGVVAGGNKTGATQNLADWTAGSLCTITMTGNCTGTSTMTSPTGVSRLTLIIVQGGAGSFTISTWPATVLWVSGTVPTLSTAVGAVDIVTFIWNGTNYFGMAGIGFA